MAWTHGWGQDLWGFSSPWGSPTTSWYYCDELQADNLGQYLSETDAKDLQFGGHAISDLTGTQVIFDESTLVADGDY